MTSLLAAMGHDLDHPGVNQTFLIATANHLAALYKVLKWYVENGSATEAESYNDVIINYKAYAMIVMKFLHWTRAHNSVHLYIHIVKQ